MFYFDAELDGNRALVITLRQMAEAFAENSDEAKKAEVGTAAAAADLAVVYSPFVTGALASSHAVFASNTETYVAIAPDSVNPFSDEDPPQYGPEVHNMGGFSRSGHERAFYDALVRHEGEDLLDIMGEEFIGTLEVFK